MNLPVVGWILGGLAVMNLGQCAAVRHYKGKAELCRAQCLIDAQAAASEAERIVSEALQGQWRIERAELESRLRLASEAAQRSMEMAEEIAREKTRIQQRLNAAMQNVDTRAWGDVPVPRSVCDATARCDSPRPGQGNGDEAHPAAGGVDGGPGGARLFGANQPGFAQRSDRGAGRQGVMRWETQLNTPVSN